MEQNNNNTIRAAWRQLTEKGIYKIEGYFEEGLKPSQIAKLIGCSVRTIQREKKSSLDKPR